ncbi:uncharacterized protein LOC122274150 [Carya illinoinensis]|uniref:EF-hand domain-containing protein n=1 Tax=Carya illinoinensis TaxID=32201 RepID=A0A8T1PQD3_CARIL|nr:uncharacterized protein LOC122274150 [Carya illinoinensis]KAG6645205.1 hypothetical protein CIPAW_08G106400 [Carya illinoinensis]
MEEICEVAKAYYANSTKQQQEEARDAFQKMNLENNKTISLTDFLDICLPDSFPKSVACSLFKELDVNRDGSLDFDEFITLFYLHQSKRLLYCHGCEKFLTGLYFTCVKCFDSTSNSYDLCSICYRKKNFQHHKDAVFLDNYALLRRNIKRSSETEVDPVQEKYENKMKQDVDESGQVKKDENESQYVSKLSDHQEINIATEANLEVFNYQEKEVANASDQEKAGNQKAANIHRYRKSERIGKAFAKLGANITTKVTGKISSAADSTDCNVM